MTAPTIQATAPGVSDVGLGSSTSGAFGGVVCGVVIANRPLQTGPQQENDCPTRAQEGR